MPKIPENILNEIQDKCDIVEVISNYIPLKPSGRNFKANCPFHHEKTPSFVVSPDKQIYHCFGCNSGGNVFNFVKEYEKIDFIDAVRLLAEKTGIKLPEYKKENEAEQSILSIIYAVNDTAAAYYKGLLDKSKDNSEIKKYIQKRGLDNAVIKAFRLGYADDLWSGLRDYLLSRGIKQDILLKAGLICKGKDGGYFDLFRNRLIFPIFDIRDRVIGFGARALGDALPKYINSPETAVYKKGQQLYGLNFAKTKIREDDFAIITEGYLDVITAHQFGTLNVVASLGTALTIDEIRLLKRYTNNVVMLYDADQAGEMASLRGLDLFLEEGVNVKVATLEKGYDPDSYLREFGQESFKKAIDSASSLFSYKLDILMKKYDKDNPESKGEIVKEMLGTINRVKNAVVKSEYIKMLSSELFLREDAVWEELGKIKKGKSYKAETNNGIQLKDVKQVDIPIAERILVRLMLEDVNMINVVKNELKPFDFKNPHVRGIIEMLFSLTIDESTQIDATKLINYFEDSIPANLVTFILNEQMEIIDKAKNISDCITRIKKENVKNRLKDIQHRLAIIDRQVYEEEHQKLLEEFNELVKKGY